MLRQSRRNSGSDVDGFHVTVSRRTASIIKVSRHRSVSSSANSRAKPSNHVQMFLKFVLLANLVRSTVEMPMVHEDGIVSAPKDDLITITESGRVRGVRYHVPYLPRPVDAYLGIPYAQPPLNSLRFRHPQPIESWSGIYNATRLPNSCYQLHDNVFGSDFQGSNVWNPPGKVSEDCLYVNVWVPRNQKPVRKAAVLVWIYGGSFYSGTTTLNLYDGKILAALNNVIVVSIGYRVGAFGFMSLGHASAPGNAGLFDQLMALEWVQQNIRYFGGDPDNVTLFGESAGSVSVSLHLLSPLSHSKFQRAILQSGVAIMPWATISLKEARRRALEMAFQYLRCPETDDMEAVAECLRKVTPQQLAEEQFVTRGVMQFPFVPVVDGVFLREHPDELVRKKAFKKCPLLMGSNANEGSYFLIYELNDLVNLTHVSMTREQFQRSVDKLFFYHPQYPHTINPFALDAIRFQYTHWEDEDDTRDNIRMLETAVGDSQFLCPANHWAKAYSEAGEKVYSYFLTQRYNSNPWPRWMGTMHGDDIMFMFGEALKPGQNYSQDDRELSRMMMSYWTNFAKTGDPNQAPGQRPVNDWPLYSPDRRQYLELNARSLLQASGSSLQASHHSPGGHGGGGGRVRDLTFSSAVGRGPRIAECAFWDVYLPKLVAETAAITHPTAAGRLLQANATCGAASTSSVSSISVYPLIARVSLVPVSMVMTLLYGCVIRSD